jgi:hypothetical protein
VKVPPENELPVKLAAVTYPVVACVTERPVPAVIVVPLTVVPATMAPVVVTVLPEKAPPVKNAAVI